MTILYEHRLSGRRPAIWLCGFAFSVFAVVMAQHGAAFVIWLPVLAGGVMILGALIRNPVNGVQMTQHRLILSPWHKPRLILLSDIEAVKVEAWTDSTDMYVQLKSGETVKVSPMDTPPVIAFRAALSARGIAVNER